MITGAGVLWLAAAAMQSPEDTTRMEAIVVTATRAEGVEAGTQSAAVAVTTPELADLAAGRVAADLLRELPGVYVQQTSAGQGAVILRGLLGNQVLLMVDGVPLNNGTYRDGPGQYLATIDPATIERIEVVRGPASVLYGSDAQGGVVNIITRPHPLAAGQSVRATGNFSSANRGYRGRASVGVERGDWSVAAGGSYSDADDLDPGGGLPSQDPTGFQTEGFDLRIDYQPSAHHTLSWVVQHFGMRDVPRYDRYVDFRAPSSGPDADHRFDPQIRQLGYARHTMTGTSPWVTRLETTASLSVQRETRIRQRLTDGTPEPLVTRTTDRAYTPGLSMVGTSAARVGASWITVNWGGDLYVDRLVSDGDRTSLNSAGEPVSSVPITRQTTTGTIESGRFPDHSEARRLGLFVSAESEVTGWLRVSGGLRWSSFHNESNVGLDFGGRVENTSSDVTAQIGVVTQLGYGVSVAARLAEGFRAPNLYDLTNVGSVPGGIVVPNPDARPERSLSSELSVRYQAPETSANLTAYRTSIDDFIDRAPGSFQGDTLFSGERIFQGLNVAEAEVWGFEAEAVRRLNMFQARATLLYTRGDQTRADGTEEPMSKIPPLKGTASVKWTAPSGRLWTAYELNWAGNQTRLGARDLRDSRIPPGGTSGYAVHGIKGGARITPELSVSAGVDNLGDELYRDHASGVDNPGRHLWVGITWVQGF